MTDPGVTTTDPGPKALARRPDEDDHQQMSRSAGIHQGFDLVRRWGQRLRNWWEDRKYGKLYRPPRSN